MTAKTDKQLEGTKTRASLAPAAKKVAPRTRKSGDDTRGVASTKAAKISDKPDQKGCAAGKAPENEKPRGGTTEGIEEDPQEVAASGTETANENEAIENAHSTGEESTSKSNGAKSSNGGTPVKPLTEAGKKRLVNKLLGLAETQATQGGFKITPADLIRLLQLHKEMTPQRDRKVTVQWIEDKPE
jgi:hypothetical protein